MKAVYGLAADTPTIGTNAVVMTSAKENAKAVAAFAQETIAEISDLRTKHPALANLTVDEVADGSIPVPLHPAARQIYKDVGLLR